MPPFIAVQGHILMIIFTDFTDWIHDVHQPKFVKVQNSMELYFCDKRMQSTFIHKVSLDAINKIILSLIINS